MTGTATGPSNYYCTRGRCRSRRPAGRWCHRRHLRRRPRRRHSNPNRRMDQSPTGRALSPPPPLAHHHHTLLLHGCCSPVLRPQPCNFHECPVTTPSCARPAFARRESGLPLFRNHSETLQLFGVFRAAFRTEQSTAQPQVLHFLAASLDSFRPAGRPAFCTSWLASGLSGRRRACMPSALENEQDGTGGRAVQNGTGCWPAGDPHAAD